jgi:hypothetical protein
MLVEIVVFAVVGTLVGAAAIRFLPTRFPGPRWLTLSTGTGFALLGGLVARFVIGPGRAPACAAVAAVTAALLVSVLARPEEVPRGAHRGGRRRRRRRRPA